MLNMTQNNPNLHHSSDKIRTKNHIHRDKSYWIKMKPDWIYHFPLHLEPNGHIHMVPNESKNGKYNLISGWFDNISKTFCAWHENGETEIPERLHTFARHSSRKILPKTHATFSYSQGNPRKVTHFHMHLTVQTHHPCRNTSWKWTFTGTTMTMVSTRHF